MPRVEHVDVVVIGSGPGGSISACELVKAGRSVVVLEEGSERSPGIEPYSRDETVALYRSAGISATLGRVPLSFAEARCVGGGSEVNSGFYHRLPQPVLHEWARVLDDFSDMQYVRLAEEVESTLPVTDSAPAESEASRRLGVGATALGWASTPVPRWITPVRTEAGWEMDRRTMGKTYLADAIRGGAQLRVGHSVVGMHSDGSSWTVRIRATQDGSISELRARSIYICAGGTGTPALLRRIGVTRGVGNSVRFHPMARLAARFSDPVTEHRAGVPVRQVTEFLPELTLGCSVADAPQVALWVGGHEVSGALRSTENFGIYYALVTSESVGVLRNVPWSPGSQILYSVRPQVCERLRRGVGRLSEVLFAAGAQHVFLPDGTGTRASSLEEVLEATADPRVVRRWLLSTIHVYGGVPAGKGKGTPLDSWGRVNGRQGLYVNDVSMLPTSIGVNPQGPLMALALRNVRTHLSAAGA